MSRPLHLIACTTFAASLLAMSALVAAQSPPAAPPLSATDSDPVRMGWMQGAPVAADRQVTPQAQAHIRFPQRRWSLQHMRQLVPSRNVWRGTGAAAPLPRTEHDWSGFTFADAQGRVLTLDAYAEEAYADALVVLHKGRVVLERYWSGMGPHTPHALFSITKSITGVLAGQLIAQGLLDPVAKVSQYLPELRGTAWEDATVEQVLDMTAAVRFSEVYGDPASDVVQYAMASGMLSMPLDRSGPRDILTYLRTLRKEGEHGVGFAYKTVHSEVAGWLIQRVTGKTFSQNLSEWIWSRMGAENDASINVDSLGFEAMGSGLNTTARDLARFGEMMRTEGQVGGMFSRQQLVSKAVVDTIRAGGDREKFKAGKVPGRNGYSYRHQWWVLHNADGAYEATGLYGQYLHINPAAEVVIVLLGSGPVAGNGPLHPLHLKAFQALADRVR